MNAIRSGVDDDRFLCAECDAEIKSPRYVRPGPVRARYCPKCRRRLGKVVPRRKKSAPRVVDRWIKDRRQRDDERRRDLDEALEIEYKYVLRYLKVVARGKARLRGVPPEDAAEVARGALARLKERPSAPGYATRAIKSAVGALKADRVVAECGDDLDRIFRRAKGGEKVGVTEKQGHAWCINEILDELEETGAIHKQEGGRLLGIDPTSFKELVDKAHRKLRATPHALTNARDLLARAIATLDKTTPLSTRRYDEMIGPWNRKGGRSVELVATPVEERDSSKTTRGGVRTAVRKVRYGPGDRHGDG